ncbi:hypothetical protein L1N85_16085 [Paenibacillus alkaliterrae]|uniref:hypothetical protein n=1 Tax=Paenibacillus alkaliterrae TaxID=320909 RepID=UPI001F325F9D|nr:hypothetical protein [Paenibacillus alkaliterrae]MCF2939937.1 hypothetical protein [Paenibacillus alkaliterrae]
MPMPKKKDLLQREDQLRQQSRHLHVPTSDSCTPEEQVDGNTASHDKAASSAPVNHGRPDALDALNKPLDQTTAEGNEADQGSLLSVDTPAESMRVVRTSSNVNGTEEDNASKSVGLAELDLSPLECTHENRDTSGPAAVSFTYTEKNGKRVAIDEEVMVALGSPDRLKVGTGPAGAAFLKCGPEDKHGFHLKESRRKKIIYSGDVVKKVSGVLNLDFSNQTTVSFYSVTFIKGDDGDIVGFLIPAQ